MDSTLRGASLAARLRRIRIDHELQVGRSRALAAASRYLLDQHVRRSPSVPQAAFPGAPPSADAMLGEGLTDDAVSAPVGGAGATAPLVADNRAFGCADAVSARTAQVIADTIALHAEVARTLESAADACERGRRRVQTDGDAGV